MYFLCFTNISGSKGLCKSILKCRWSNWCFVDSIMGFECLYYLDTKSLIWLNVLRPLFCALTLSTQRGNLFMIVTPSCNMAWLGWGHSQRVIVTEMGVHFWRFVWTIWWIYRPTTYGTPVVTCECEIPMLQIRMLLLIREITHQITCHEK